MDRLPHSDTPAQAPGWEIIELYPHETECVLCGEHLYVKDSYGLPMYEGEVVPDDWPGNWAGFMVCPICYRKHRPEPGQ